MNGTPEEFGTRLNDSSCATPCLSVIAQRRGHEYYRRKPHTREHSRMEGHQTDRRRNMSCIPHYAMRMLATIMKCV
jgi:hypothetical protein